MANLKLRLLACASLCLAVGWAAVELASQGPPEHSELKSFLRSVDGRMRLFGIRYDGNRVRARRELTAREGVWRHDTTVTRQNDSMDVTITVGLTSGTVADFGVAVAFDFSNWTIENYVLAPALIYGGNRFRVYDTPYPPYIEEEAKRPLDMPVTTTNILRLNQDGSHAKIEMNTGNLATPMLGFFSPRNARGFILLTEQATRFGNNGMFIEEDAGPGVVDKRATFVISAPGVREQRYRMGGRDATNDKGGVWKAGEEVTIKIKVYNFECASLESFYAKAFDVRKALSGPNSYTNVTPYSVAADLILRHHNATKWYETNRVGYYNYNPSDTVPSASQVGWAGVPIHSFPHLIAEAAERLRRVSLSMDSVVVGMQGPTGLYYAMSDGRGNVFGDTFATSEKRRSIAMIRRSMDVLYFGAQTILLLRQRGHSDLVNPEWEKSLRRTADGLSRVWNEYGQFGQFIDVESGKMDINGSTAGAAAGSALALASRLFNEPRYLDVAEASMKMYYNRDFQRGYAGGGAAEILQSPDAETPYDMLESCIALYEITGKAEWLERAKFVAHMLATWVVSYDYRFPIGTAMERAGTRATGSIFASSQNNHSAPGYFILPGDALLKLFRATGDKRYAELYKDQSHNVIQYLGAPHNPLRTQVGVTERVQLSDWEGADSIGHVQLAHSDISWETLVALTALVNPGIYLHTDDDTLLVMDHVEAEVLEATATSRTIKIKNPTPYDAQVSILAESGEQSKQPLGWGAYDKWPRVHLSAGETKQVRVGDNPGEIQVLAGSR